MPTDTKAFLANRSCVCRSVCAWKFVLRVRRARWHDASHPSCLPFGSAPISDIRQDNSLFPVTQALPSTLESLGAIFLLSFDRTGVQLTAETAASTKSSGTASIRLEQ